ncbi:MAG: hypothetical protein NTZ16_14870 [Verrucomicrobia bacterium]|nr:hypothetical protein [Verrucomicrobiota bacterium]
MDEFHGVPRSPVNGYSGEVLPVKKANFTGAGDGGGFVLAGKGFGKAGGIHARSRDFIAARM